MTVRTPGPFADNVGQPLSATDLLSWQRLVAQLQGMVQRAVPVQVNAHWQQQIGGTARFQITGDGRIWWGALRKRAGLTGITFVVRIAAKNASETLRVYLNGSATPAATFSAIGTTTTTVPFPAGTSNGDVVSIEVRTAGRAKNGNGEYHVTAYADGLALADTWPGVPAFSGQFQAAQLQQLSDAAAWLYRRMALVPFVLTPWLLGSPTGKSMTAEWSATHNGGVSTLASGSFVKHNPGDRLLLSGYRRTQAASERLNLWVNGTKYTVGTYGPGNSLIPAFTVDLSALAIGQVYEWFVQTETLSTPNNQALTTASCYSISRLEVVPAAWTNTATIAELPVMVTTGEATVRAVLNGVASRLQAIKNTIDATPHLWSRAWAFRKTVAYDSRDPILNEWMFPPSAYRRGSKLFARGQGVKLGWGVATSKQLDDGRLAIEFDSQQETSLMDGSKVADTEFVFDDKTGLVNGALYWLTQGLVEYAEETIE